MMDDPKDPNQEQPMGGGMPQPEAGTEGAQPPVPGTPAEGAPEGGAPSPEVPGDAGQPGEAPAEPAVPQG